MWLKQVRARKQNNELEDAKVVCRRELIICWFVSEPFHMVVVWFNVRDMEERERQRQRERKRGGGLRKPQDLYFHSCHKVCSLLNYPHAHTHARTQAGTHARTHTHTHTHTHFRYRAKVVLHESSVMQCSVLRLEV